MPSPPPTNREILHAYRHLTQLGLRAIQHSQPASHTLRTYLRLCFRLSPRSAFDAKRIRNTQQFLYNAAVARSLENKVLRTLLTVEYWNTGSDGQFAAKGRDLKELTGVAWQKRVAARDKQANKEKKGMEEVNELRGQRREGYMALVRGLNESMGMCIR